MQHAQILYLLVTAFIGMISLGIATAEYLKTKESLLRSYIFFHIALTLLVVSELLFSYVSLNLPDLHYLVVGFLHYLNVFVAQYALMVTFPVFIHALFSVHQAQKRNLVFFVLTVIFCIEGHVMMFLVQHENSTIINHIDNLAFMLVFFYGFVTGLSEYKHCEPDRARLTKHFLLLLGLFMPAIIIDTLLYDTFPVLFYPIVYCSFSIGFTYHLTQYAVAHSHPKTSTLSGEDETKKESGTDAGNVLTEALYQQYNISPREQDVLPLLIQGVSNQQIADTLYISLNTVKAHLRNIYAKFDVKNRYELFAFLKHGNEALISKADSTDRD